MNYLAHGWRFVDDPYFLAGTAAPDWLNVVDRRVRVRAARAESWLGDGDPRMAALAAGIVQHQHDDGWFHESLAFFQLSSRLTVAVRAALPPDEGFRPAFLGHILVELLLDATLFEDEPQRLERYYAAIAEIDADFVEAAIGQIAGKPAERLAQFVQLFLRERFLWDYADDGKLLIRLNQVLRRVGVPLLPESFVTVLGPARDEVRRRASELLEPAIIENRTTESIP